MRRRLFSFMNSLKLRWKLLVVVLPLVVIPIFLVGGIIGYISYRQANLGITQTSKDDLQHMADFTIDLLDAHYRQFEVYRKDKRRSFNLELSTLANLATNLVAAENDQYRRGRIDLATAQSEARRALKRVNVGKSGYIYAMTGKGVLKVHVTREGQNLSNERDGNGRYFIREMCEKAVRSRPGEVLFISYPWKNPALGDRFPRTKVVAYRYFRDWDWIIAVGDYLDESAGDVTFERNAFEELKGRIKNKKVGKTGYIYCMDGTGTFTIHPDAEGKNFYDATDSDGNRFIREMCVNRSGWIRYPWKNPRDPAPRMKIVRYEYFKPWNWIVAVGSYEDEFYQEANEIKWRIFVTMTFLTAMVCFFAVTLVFMASRVLTDPINHMMEVIRKIKQGRLDERMEVASGDELGELGEAFNRMTQIIKHNQEMEANLARQSKMASLGVLSSGVAHEINNPLGVILGYASYLEGKLDPADPHYRFISEIKRESKRCKKIVQDLLSFARTPKPTLTRIDINGLLDQIVDFAANHTDMHHVSVVKEFAPDLPEVMVDSDQIRQVAINLVLNAGAAMTSGGKLVVSTAREDDNQIAIRFADNGSGIPPENLERIFEPFFTTKEKGTGLGLAITKQIIEQHMGKIVFASEVGKGTTVTVLLPIEREIF